MRERTQMIRVSSSLILVAAAMFTGCARTTAGTQHAYGAECGEIDLRAKGADLTPPVPRHGPRAATTPGHPESAIDMARVRVARCQREDLPANAGGIMDGQAKAPAQLMRIARVEGHAENASDPDAERHSTMTVDAPRAAQGGGTDRAYLKQRAVQRGEAPMTRMQPGSAASRAGSMTDMMGAPGLVPFEIMTGQAGKWMVGYQFMSEKMDGNLVGTDDISEAEILASYFATPTDMTMQMHMFMVMHAPTDKLVLMAMLPYVRKEMNHLTVDGERFAERTDGIGDIELRGTYSAFARKDLHHRLLLHAGVGLPTGSIDAMMGGMRLEYPMHIGSGTTSLMPGITYLGQSLPWGWAADFHSTVRLGQNDNGYRLGDRHQSSVSIARELTNWLSLSVGVRGVWWGNISGTDPLLDPADEPTKDANLQGGKRLSASLGVTVHPQNGPLEGQHFHVLLEAPVVESLNGPQLSESWVIRLGWQLEF